jgi:hypothetical protein
MIIRRPWHLIGTGIFLTGLLAGCGEANEPSASKLGRRNDKGGDSDDRLDDYHQGTRLVRAEGGADP